MDPSGERDRVTAETVEQARQERENAYISLMDEMEKNVREKGQYFVKFGDKNKGINGTTDTRALLLIKSAVDPKDSSNIFIAITREGAKGLRFIPQDKNPEDQDEKAEEQMKGIIQGKLGGKDPQELATELRNGLLRDGRLLINDLAMNSFYFPSDTTEIRPVDLETVKNTIDESQRAAEIPHFLQLQREQQGLADANALIGVINKLPPK